MVFPILILVFLYYSSHSQESRFNISDIQKKEQITCQSLSINNKSDSLFYKIIKINNGWGYDIYMNEKIYIHQNCIPAISGYKNFICKEDAEKIAKVIIEKIKNHIIPPSITKDELNKNGIITEKSNH